MGIFEDVALESQIKDLPKSKIDKTNDLADENITPSNFWKEVSEISSKTQENKTEKKEGFLKSAARTAYQPLGGFLQKFTYPLDLLQMFGGGDVLDPDEIEQIRKISERSGIPFDEKQYIEQAQQAQALFPTQSNIEKLVESKTGAPLTPQTEIQKLARLGGTAAGFTPGSIAQRGTAAVTAPLVKEGLTSLGVPEGIAEFASIPTAITTGKSVPSLSQVPKLKPSGIPERKFESLEKTRSVSEPQYQRVVNTIREDFDNATNKIKETSPVNTIENAVKENPNFVNELESEFEKVNKIAEYIPTQTPKKVLRQKLMEKIDKSTIKGLSESEYEVEKNKFFKSNIKKIQDGNFKAVDLIDQYRKNNKELSQYYDPGRSYAYNRAKKDALLLYNEGLSDIITSKYPETNLGELFKETNNKYSQLMDYRAINEFTESLFKEKIDYNKARKFFDNENIRRPFERGLGKQGFEDFKTVMKDMLSTESGFKQLKIAESKGWLDLANNAKFFIFGPKIGSAKTIYSIGKDLYKEFMDLSLTNPKYMRDYRFGYENLKNGNFEAASKTFSQLKKDVEDSMEK